MYVSVEPVGGRELRPHWTTAAKWLEVRLQAAGIIDPVSGVSWAPVVLGLVMAAFAATFSSLVVQRHDYFGTFDFDQGIFDQGIWLVSRGESFMTIRGLDFWGHHANIGLLLFVPFYWLGAGPNFLNVTMVVAATLGCIPVYRLGVRHLGNEWHAIVPPIAYLAHFSLQWVLNETIHPDILAITPFFFAYLAAVESRWRAYALWLVLAMSFKEDIALAAFMLGFVLVIRKQRRAGAWTMVGAVAWFLFCTQVLIPTYSPEDAFYSSFFGELGSTPTEVATNSVLHPTMVYDQIEAHDGTGYVRDLNLPYGGLALLSPLTLLIGLPNTLVNLLNVHGLSANTHAHYIAMPLASATLAMVEGLGRLRRLPVRRFALGLVAVCATTTSALWGLAPYSLKYEYGFWQLGPGDRQALMEQAIAIPDADDRVSASYNLVPHVAHRPYVYTFPNPWIASNWGIAGEDTHDPSTIEWLLIDRSVLGEESRTLLQRVLRSPDWTIVMDQENVLVAHRTDAP